MASLVIFRDLHLATNGIVTDGVVEQVTEKASSNSSAKSVKGEKRTGDSSSNNQTSQSYFVDVRFTPKGVTEPVLFTTRSTFRERHQAGDEVKIIYLPEAPQNAEIYSNQQVWYPIYAGSAFSLVILGIGLLMIRISRPSNYNNFNPTVDRF